MAFTKITGNWRWGSLPLSGAVVIMLSACSYASKNFAPVTFSSEDDLQKSVAEPLQGFRGCRKDSLEFDKAARTYADDGKYMASAKLAEKCVRALPKSERATFAREAMQLYALALKNYVIAGDAKAARKAYAAMEKQFPDQDLIFKDASSVKETFAYILAIRHGKDSDNFRRANINQKLKAELRRLHYHRIR